MNLIKQLGGYECAAYEYKNTLLADDFPYVITGTKFTRPELGDELLEHRRQHNIFEKGDPVVSRCADKETRIFTYQETIGKNILVKCKKGKGYCYPKKWFSHADDEEIKAGKRLEVNQ
ncbi:hypothetical protein QFL75_003216 [Acinetobacter baumannii]|nr:hypothetical protein [Acinetobacter baumannii]